MDPATPLFDTTFWITSGAIILLLILSAFFSGSETALTVVSRGKLRAKSDKGSKAADQALKITDDKERLIGSILLGNNLANILAASLATALFTRMFGDNGVALATLVMTFLVLIFAEVLPKSYAITNPERAAILTSPLIRPFIWIFSPIVTAVRALVRGILRLFGVLTDPDSQILAVREEIAGAISLGHHEGAVEREDRDRLLGALDLGDRSIEEIMRHRSEIEMIDISLPPQQVLEKVLQSAHTRLPLFKEHQENIVGVLHAKDMLRAVYAWTKDRPDTQNQFDGFDVMDVAKKPYFAPETTPLDDQMREFLRRNTHFALVVDEYGVLQGLITLEDILEEIVGEITDEFDTETELGISRTDSGDWLVDGATTIRDLNRENDWNLPDDEANTIAGLVMHEAQMIPAVGQVFSFHDFRFEVMKRSGNRVTCLKIRPL
ncbi:MAG: hypothetical protein COB40_03480 [Marinosulfonomonas sp.]|nr:MAG: hypothetical protein COB40_03480 [Marinosulfonomonas sp.]